MTVLHGGSVQKNNVMSLCVEVICISMTVNFMSDLIYLLVNYKCDEVVGYGCWLQHETYSIQLKACCLFIYLIFITFT